MIYERDIKLSKSTRIKLDTLLQTAYCDHKYENNVSAIIKVEDKVYKCKICGRTFNRI